ncbi:CG7705 [Drosophila busckii]|uniref:CG7705 n=2 Tax=Drosophila busckii TaxID=30019 RepID=A0A0M4EEW3_DROBS|nr:CG7705 [Drosophila busckii]
MERIKACLGQQQLTDELKQRQAITDHLLQLILYSKRLLVDHVEALEQCMQQHAARANDWQLLTTRNAALLLGGTVLEHFVTPRGWRLTLLPAILLSGTFGTLYGVKNVFVCRNKIVERKLEKLVKTIDEFGNCIRRNMTYFQEIIIMKQAELIESRQIERAWDCITAAKEVTEILYDATRKLETDYPLPTKYGPFYASMEELRECEYFKNNVTDYSPKHIKDFHNIFAYVQSQYLLRLALTIMTKPSISQLSEEFVKIDNLLQQLVQEEEQHFKNLALAMQNKQQMELAQLHASKTQQQQSGPIAVLQHSSLKLSACMVAVAGECQALDVTLQQLTATEAAHKNNTKHLVAVAHNMRGIENALAVCCDDFQRLMLVYNKFLHSKLDLELDTPRSSSQAAKSDEFPESILRVEFSEQPDDPQGRDDFYAYMYDAEEARQQEDQHAPYPTPEKELLNFEKRITKSKFKPVLRQLKDRIDPIRQVMLQKEREVLTAKGINVDELFGKMEQVQDEQQQLDNRITEAAAATATQSDYDGSSSGSDSADEAAASSRQRSKQLKERDNFAEMRQFLAQKQAINLFKLDAAMPTAAPEELLESEC